MRAPETRIASLVRWGALIIGALLAAAAVLGCGSSSTGTLYPGPVDETWEAVTAGVPILISQDKDIGMSLTALAVGPTATRVYVGGGSYDRDGENLAVLSLDTNGKIVGRPVFFPQAATAVPLEPNRNSYVTDIVVDAVGQRLYVSWANWSGPTTSTSSLLSVYTLDSAGNITSGPRSYSCATATQGACTGLYSLALNRATRTLYAGASAPTGGVIVAYTLNASGEPTVQLGAYPRGNDGTIAQLAVRSNGDKLYATGSGSGLVVLALDAQGRVGNVLLHQVTNNPSDASDYLFYRFLYTSKAIYRRPSGGWSQVSSGFPPPIPLTYWPLDAAGLPVSSGPIALTSPPPVVDVAAANGNLLGVHILRQADAFSGTPTDVGTDAEVYAVDAQGRPSATSTISLSTAGQMPLEAATSTNQYPVVITRFAPSNINFTKDYHLRVSITNATQATCPSSLSLDPDSADPVSSPLSWVTATGRCESAWLPLDTLPFLSAGNRILPLKDVSSQYTFYVSFNAPFPNPSNVQIDVAQGNPTSGGTTLVSMVDTISTVTSANQMLFLLPGYAYPGDRFAAMETLTHRAQTWAGWANAVAVPTAQRPRQFTISGYYMQGRQGSTQYLGFMADALSRLGINTIGVSSNEFGAGGVWGELGMSTVFNALNQRGITNRTYATYEGPSGNTFDFQCDSACIDTWANGWAQHAQTEGTTPSTVREFALNDEPGWRFPDALQLVNGVQANLVPFRTYMQAHGFPNTVTAIGRASALDSSSLAQRQQFYWTTKYFEQAWLNRQKGIAQAVRARFPQAFEHVNFVTNPQRYHQYLYGQWPAGTTFTADVAMGTPDWFLSGRASGHGFWSEDWYGDNAAQRTSYVADMLRSASSLGTKSFGSYVVGSQTGQHPEGASYKILSLVGHGAKAIDIYSFGPTPIWRDANTWSDDQPAYGPIAKALRRVGTAESALYPGLPQRSKVAVQLRGASDLWQKIPSPFPSCTTACLGAYSEITAFESEGLHFALNNQGYAVDFVDETDLATPGLLAQRGYRVVYLTELNISTAAQQQIASWVSTGGTIVATAGAGLWDEYNTPSTGGTNTLLGVLGLNPPSATGSWTHLRDPFPGNVGSFNVSDFRNGNPSDPSSALYADMTQTSTSYQIPSGLIRMFAAALAPINQADVIARFDGPVTTGPAVTAHQHGSGTAIAYGFLPGTEYLISQDRKAVNRLASGWDDNARTRAVAPVVKVNPSRNVFASVRGVEALRLDSAGPTIAVVLLNWTDKPLSSVTITVAGAANRSVTSVEGNPITRANSGTNLNVTLPLNAVDILTIR